MSEPELVIGLISFDVILEWADKALSATLNRYLTLLTRSHLNYSGIT